MATGTYVALATYTASGGETDIEFASIPTDGTYRDLVLVANAAASTTAVFFMRLNGQTSSSYYTYVRMAGTGSSAFTDSQASAVYFRTNAYADVTTSMENNLILQFLDYAATDKDTTVLMRSNTASTGTDAIAGRFKDTTAISTILLYLNTGTISAGSTFSLYGIAS